MVDAIYTKGYRTSMAYFPEKIFGTYSLLGATNESRRIGGKLKSVSWNARQAIIQTGNLGQGRNYQQQLYGQYDANASLSYEVSDFSFLRFGVGDIAKWNNSGAAEATPYFLLSGEISGTDGTTGANDLLKGADTSAYTTVRVRPFSMLLYDLENSAAGTTTYSDNIDRLNGCIISDFSLSASVNTPLMCSVNMLVKEVHYKINAASGDIPNFGLNTASDNDLGNADYETTGNYGTPLGTENISLESPLMFYGGGVYMGNTTGAYTALNQLGQVTSFNYSYNNSLITYRTIGSRFIEMPLLGLRRQTLGINVVFNIPQDSNLRQGIAAGSPSQTSIIELIKGYMGYAAGYTITNTQVLKPALSSITTGGTSPQTNVPVEISTIMLRFKGFTTAGNEKGAMIAVRNATVEGFGVPLSLENGMIEVPISLSIRGQTYGRGGDGSYGDYLSTGTPGNAPYTSSSALFPTFVWWRGA